MVAISSHLSVTINSSSKSSYADMRVFDFSRNDADFGYHDYKTGANKCPEMDKNRF